MKRTKQILAIIMFFIGVGCLAVAATLIIKYAREDRQSAALGEEYGSRPVESESRISLPDETEPMSTPESTTPLQEASSEPESEPESESVLAPEPEPVVNPYAASYLANSDMVGWLVIPGTVIDYPVMWTPEDENYYLRRGFDKKKSTAGCLILDTDSALDPLTTNLIIHGHNMKAGTMFGTLGQYEKEDFYQDHKEIILYTEECQRNYEVLAVFRSQVYKKSDTVFKFYKFFQADTEEEFYDFYDNIMEMSMYDTGVTAEFGDHFITLSTCSYHVDNGRFVVVAKEVERGDTYLPLEASEDNK
ncbi:MAG: sortase [Lachnospiraceae bacterium]|nr:sortase [Lachnospiraceae bacterium]